MKQTQRGIVKWNKDVNQPLWQLQEIDPRSYDSVEQSLLEFYIGWLRTCWYIQHTCTVHRPLFTLCIAVTLGPVCEVLLSLCCLASCILYYEVLLAGSICQAQVSVLHCKHKSALPQYQYYISLRCLLWGICWDILQKTDLRGENVHWNAVETVLHQAESLCRNLVCVTNGQAARRSSPNSLLCCKCYIIEQTKWPHTVCFLSIYRTIWKNGFNQTHADKQTGTLVLDPL